MISPFVSISSCVDGLGYVSRSPLIIKRNPEYKLLPVVQSTALARKRDEKEEEGGMVRYAYEI